MDHDSGPGQEGRLDHVQRGGAQAGAVTSGESDLLEDEELLGQAQLGLHLLPHHLRHQADPQPAAEHQHLLLPHDVGEVQLPAGNTASVQLQAVEETLEALLEVLDLTESAGHEVQHRPGLGTGEQLLGEAPADQVGRDEAGGALTEEETVPALP